MLTLFFHIKIQIEKTGFKCYFNSAKKSKTQNPLSKHKFINFFRAKKKLYCILQEKQTTDSWKRFIRRNEKEKY